MARCSRASRHGRLPLLFLVMQIKDHNMTERSGNAKKQQGGKSAASEQIVRSLERTKTMRAVFVVRRFGSNGNNLG